MTGSSWASHSQTEFLWTFYSDYIKVNKGDKNYVPFWANLREKWFEMYPEHEVCFPDKEVEDLLPEEQAQVTEDIQARIKQLKTWFRWRANPRASMGGRRGRLADLEPFEERTRQLKDYEMYSKLYYDEKIKPLVEEVESELAGSMELSKGEKLNLRKRIARDLYEGEDEDVKVLVIAKLKERAKVLENQKNDDVDRTPEQYLRSIKDAPGILGRCLDGLHVGSGWTYLVVMGGPHPLSNGEIAVASYNAGPEGADFSQSYPDIQKTYMARFTEYLEKIYPEVTRLERALTHPLDLDDEPDNNGPESDPQLSTAPAPKKKQPAKQSVRPSLTNTEAASVDGQRTCSETLAMDPNASTAVPTDEPGPSNNVETWETGIQKEFAAGGTLHLPDESTTRDDPSIDPNLFRLPNDLYRMPAGLDQFNQFNEDSTMVGMGFNLNDDDSWRSLDINPQFSADPAFETTAFGLDCGFNLQFPSFNSANLSLDTPASCSSSTSNFTPIFPNDSLNPSFSVVTPALVNASQPSQFIGASFMQFQPTAALAPAFPHTSALLPSRSNASSPTVTVVPGNAPQPIPAMSNASPQPTTTPSTPVSPPSHGESNQPGATPSVAGDASLPPAQNSSSQHDQAAAVSQPVHTGAKNCTTPLSPSLNSDSPLSQLASNPGTPALASDSATSSSVTADGRRSGRNPVPSKRHEQMNEIDGKAKNKTTASAHIEKENIHSTTPKWTITSHDYLLKSNLGDDWTACVQAWFELEHELGYGSQAGAKGALPLTATRPQEWASWTSKSRGGVRNYQCTPSIVDAAEFGIAIQGWWNSIQPSFRKSDTGIPTTIYSSPTGDKHTWASLRKGGPNGLISLLTLLLWWGQALAKQSQWQTDSSPDWKHMVLDVTKCLISMKDLNGAASLKRKAATTSQEKEKKRARISV